LYSDNAFLSIEPSSQLDSPNYLRVHIQRFRLAAILVVGESEKPENLEEIGQTFDQIHESLFLTKIDDKNGNLPKISAGTRFLYAIQTSGTTGQPKPVVVPREAIGPNCVDFAWVFLALFFILQNNYFVCLNF
jgi:acyl-coenzyme A synthetase/AMP-(fatty) acid ligase